MDIKTSCFITAEGSKGVSRMQLLRKKGLLDSPRVLFLPVDAISPNPNPAGGFWHPGTGGAGWFHPGSGAAPAPDCAPSGRRLGAGSRGTAAPGRQAGRTGRGPLHLSPDRRPALLPAGSGRELAAQGPGLLGGGPGPGPVDLCLPSLPGGGCPAHRARASPPWPTSCAC